MRVAAVLASVLALGLAAVGTLDVGRDPIAQASIEMLDGQARAAADVGAFIYPPVEDPGAATAYSTVMALEALGDDGASQRAAALRVEFADVLAAMGDKYWEIDGGRGFASDFYAAALLFQPERSALRERTAITIGEFAQLRRRAEAGEFTQAELEGAAVLSALAEPDDDAGAVRLERLTRNDTALPSSVRVDAQRVLAQRVPKRAPPAAAAEGNAPVVASASAASSRPAVGSGPATDAAAPSIVAASPATAPTAHVDADAARRAIGQGRVHLKAGEFAAAETSFHRALEADARSHEALSGLSEVYFNRAAHQKALSFAKRAVTLAPRRAEYRMQLGDAYFKVLRYDDARGEYEAALDLGHAPAKAALARLRSRLGEDR